MTDRLAALTAAKIVAVLRGPSREGTVRAVDALVEGGITGIEVTYSTPDAAGVISELHDRYGSAIVLGGGTIRTPAQAKEASDAGATFLVSPGITAELAHAMKETGRVTLFGALTPSEVLNALALGADIVKLFPASLGGPAYLRSLRGPLPEVPFCPTGGVDAGNVQQWFAAGAVALGAGSELCSSADITAEAWEAITTKARAFAQAAGI